PDMLCITESWLNCDIFDFEVSIYGYVSFRCDRSQRIGGG
ncbi:hypothetical protein B4U79_14818, partial [Dinothrombium tinctorium]